MLQENRSLEHASNETNQKENKSMFTVSADTQGNPKSSSASIRH